MRVTAMWRAMVGICSVVLLFAQHGDAATARWTNTANNAVGSWTDPANWSAATYPGQTSTSDHAFLTNTVPNSVYTAKVDSSPANSISNVTVWNTGSAGEAWLVVTNATLISSNTLTLGTGGRLRIVDGGQLLGYTAVIDDPVPAGTDSILIANGGIWSNTYNMIVGNSSNSGQMTIRNGGKVYSGGSGTSRNYLGYNAGANSNTVMITDSGSVWQTTFDVAVGNNGVANSLVVSNGGAAVLSGTFENGLAASTLNNAVVVTGNGSVLSNNGVFYVGYNGSSNTLTVSDQGRFWATGLYFANAASSIGNSMILTDTGTTATITGTMYLGYRGDGDRLVVSNGAQIISVGTGYVANTNAYHTAFITGGGSMWSNSGALYLGNNGWGSGVSVGNSGLFVAGNHVYIGNSAVAVSNTLAAGGAGSKVNVVGNVYVGYSGSYNSLYVTNGATLVNTGKGDIGVTANSMGNAVYVSGSGSVWSNGSTLYLGGDDASGGGASNSLTVSDSGTLVIAGNGTLGFLLGSNSSRSNKAVITTGGRVFSTSVSYVGRTGGSNVVSISNGGLWDVGVSSLYVGETSSGNSILITDGGVLTNVTGSTFRIGGTGASNNSVICTNGGVMYVNGPTFSVGAVGTAAGGSYNTVVIGGGYVNGGSAIYIGNGSISNLVRVTGSALLGTAGGSSIFLGVYGAATGNTVRVDNGGTINKIANLYVGTNDLAAGNVVLVESGGSAYVSGAVTVGGPASVNNTLTILSGGLLDANTLTVGAGSGNLITNSGGIYQFTAVSTPLTPNGTGRIALNNGVVSYRNMTGVNVYGNFTGSLTNMSFTGNNAFRLNNSTNSMAATPQSYTFAPNVAPTYAGLELVSGNTAYTNGTVSIASGGWLTFSNTSAVMWNNVTNNGTMTITNSTVLFKQNLTLGESCTLIQNSNSTVTVTGNISLPTSATLVLSGAVGESDQVVLFQTTTGTISGTAANWGVTPNDHRVTVSSDGKRLMLLPTRRGFMFIVE